MNTDEIENQVDVAGPFVKLMLPNDNDDAPTGNMPIDGISTGSTYSVGTSKEGENSMRETKRQLALPVPLTMSGLQECGLGLAQPSGESARVAVRSVRWYVEHSRARSTIRSYELWWRLIVTMCEEWGVSPLPIDAKVAPMIPAEMANRGYEWKTIDNACNALRMAHRFAGHPDPTRSPAMQAVRRGIARVLGTGPKCQKVAISVRELALIAAAAQKRPESRGVQEWALMALGFFGALRRSEIVALDIGDISFDGDEMRIFIVKSKTDQFGTGETVVTKRAGDPLLCPVAAVEAWLALCGQPEGGPLFRRILPGGRIAGRLSGRSVARVAQHYAAAMGLRKSEVGAHSLRAGYVTEMILAGVNEVEVAAHSRHRSLDSLSTYFRPRNRRINYTTLLVEGR